MSPTKAKRSISKRGEKTEPVPAALVCWGFANWPQHVYPHKPEAGRHLVDTHRDSLLRAGVLSRIGKEVVINGLRYAEWIKRQPWNQIEMPTTGKSGAASTRRSPA